MGGLRIARKEEKGTARSASGEEEPVHEECEQGDHRGESLLGLVETPTRGALDAEILRVELAHRGENEHAPAVVPNPRRDRLSGEVLAECTLEACVVAGHVVPPSMGEPEQLELPDAEHLRRFRDVGNGGGSVIPKLADERLH